MNFLLSKEQRFHVSETFAREDIAEWMNSDELQNITDDMIADIVEKYEREMTHSECLSLIAKIIEYIGQQEEATNSILVTLIKLA